MAAKNRPREDREKQIELPTMPALPPVQAEGHGTTPTDPRRRNLGVERRERQKHQREQRKKHAG